MTEYYVMYAGVREDFNDLDSAKARAKALGSEAVLHLSGGTIETGIILDGITGVIDELTACDICGGPDGGAAAGVNVTLNDCDLTGHALIVAGTAASASTVVVSGASTAAVNGGIFDSIVAVAGGACGDVTVNLSDGLLTDIAAFRSGGLIDGAFTLNIAGGTIEKVFLASDRNAVSGTIDGGLHVNISEGLIVKNFLITPENSASVVNGGVWIDLTGGTFAKNGVGATVTSNHVFGSGNGENSVVNGGVHITVGGFVSGDHTWIYGANIGKVHGLVEMSMSSGNIRMFTGGGAQSDQEYDVSISMSGGIIGYITGGCYQNQELIGDVAIDITGGTLLYTFNGAGNKIGSYLVGNVVTNISGATTLMAATDDFTISGSGFHMGDAAMNIAGGTFTTIVSGLGKRAGCGIEGNISLNVTGGLFTNETVNIFGGGKNDGTVDGNIDIDIAGGTFAGSIYLAGGTSTVHGNGTLTIGAVSIAGGVYAGTAYEGSVEGDLAITVDGTSIGGTLSGAGSGDFSQKSGHTSTLTVGAGGVTAATVRSFSSISIAAGATITAGTLNATAITADTANLGSGTYTLATGFTPRSACAVTITDGAASFGSVSISRTVTTGSISVDDVTYTVTNTNGTLTLEIAGKPTPPPAGTAAEVILTITDPTHAYFGATGGWKVQSDQTVAWQDLTTLGAGYSYLGLGATTAAKAMPDIYVYNADAKYIAAYTTDATGAITGFESIFSGEAALSQVGIADFNADGVSDLLLRTADGFVGYYANGAFAEVQGLGTEWTVAALGDVDGNGRADVIIAHEAGYVGAYLIGNDGSITWADLGNLDSSTQIVGAGDVNGDGTDDVIVQVGANYYGAWTCSAGAVSGFFGIGEFDASVQDIADYNADGKDDLLFRTSGGVVGAALITGADTTTWAEYGALGAEWSTKGVGIL